MVFTLFNFKVLFMVVRCETSRAGKRAPAVSWMPWEVLLVFERKQKFGSNLTVLFSKRNQTFLSLLAQEYEYIVEARRKRKKKPHLPAFEIFLIQSS